MLPIMCVHWEVKFCDTKTSNIQPSLNVLIAIRFYQQFYVLPLHYCSLALNKFEIAI